MPWRFDLGVSTTHASFALGAFGTESIDECGEASEGSEIVAADYAFPYVTCPATPPTSLLTPSFAYRPSCCSCPTVATSQSYLSWSYPGFQLSWCRLGLRPDGYLLDAPPNFRHNCSTGGRVRLGCWRHLWNSAQSSATRQLLFVFRGFFFNLTPSLSYYTEPGRSSSWLGAGS